MTRLTAGAACAQLLFVLGLAQPAMATESDPGQETVAPPSTTVGQAWEGFFPSSAQLGWDGNMELDVGYAAYGFADNNFPPQDFHDFRGRLVFGPTFRIDLGSDYLLEMRGEAVLWVRERFNVYQINTDDVWARIGNDYWNLQVGRFFGWWVFNKGLGFDLFTLEDTGAHTDNVAFGADLYEVNHLFFRSNGPGDAAIHLYPIPDTLGIQAKLVFGQDLQERNVLGGRVAADLDLDYLRLVVGAEITTSRPSIEIQTQNVEGIVTPCDDCDRRQASGFGASLTLNLHSWGVPLELAGNYAASSFERNSRIAPGSEESQSTGTLQSFGGVASFDVGKVAFGRSLLIGGGWFRTTVLPNNNDFSEHDQGSAFVLFPLGYNDLQRRGPGAWPNQRFTTSHVKLVFSSALATLENDTGDGVTFLRQTSDMQALRLRFTFMF